MLFESEHKTFDQQVDSISTGNVIGNVQRSGHIRPYSKTECNGKQFPAGHLQNYDLGFLNEHLREDIRNWIRGQDGELIGYSFFYWKGMRRVLIGWIITDSKYRLIRMEPTRRNAKTISALQECAKYVSQEVENG